VTLLCRLVLEHPEDVSARRGTNASSSRKSGTPYTGAAEPLNDRRPVVCSSVSNYGLACLASGCSDFNPFAARCAHIRRRIFIAAAGISLFAPFGSLVRAIQWWPVRHRGEDPRRTSASIQLAALSKRIIKLTRRDLTATRLAEG